MKRLTQLFILIAAGVGLAACNSLPPKPVGQPDTATWHTRRSKLQTLDNWQLKGKIAVNNADKGNSGSMIWVENAPHFEMEFAGPFGAGAFRLYGTPSGLFIDSSGKTRYTNDPAKFLARQLSAPVPVKSLRFWVLGLPDPNGTAKVRVDQDGLLRRLHQYGWSIRYDRFTTTNDGWTLPTRLEAKRGKVTLKVVVESWKVFTGALIFD